MNIKLIAIEFNEQEQQFHINHGQTSVDTFGYKNIVYHPDTEQGYDLIEQLSAQTIEQGIKATTTGIRLLAKHLMQNR